MALVKVSLAGAVTALGGVVGYVLVDQLHRYLPYFLVVASSSFMYVALADLIPQLQKRLSARETAAPASGPRSTASPAFALRAGAFRPGTSSP